MINLKVLSTVAALALVLPLAAPTAGFAQGHVRGGGGGGGGAVGVRGGGGGHGGMSMGGGGMRMGGAGIRAGGGGQFAGARVGGGQQFAAGRVSGGNFNGGGFGHHHHHHGGGFWPGVAAGAFVGGALASDYYGPYGYYGDDYYDNGYYDDGGVAVVGAAPVEGDGSAYCAQRYRSYDPASGTYLGYDGMRHPCP